MEQKNLGSPEASQNTQPLVTLATAARETGITRKRLRAAISAGALPAYQVGAWLRVRLGDVDRWLEFHRYPKRVTYEDLLESIEGLPPDAASVKWVYGLDPESPISVENSILIPAQARLDHRSPRAAICDRETLPRIARRVEEGEE